MEIDLVRRDALAYGVRGSSAATGMRGQYQMSYHRRRAEAYRDPQAFERNVKDGLESGTAFYNTDEIICIVLPNSATARHEHYQRSRACHGWPTHPVEPREAYLVLKPEVGAPLCGKSVEMDDDINVVAEVRGSVPTHPESSHARRDAMTSQTGYLLDGKCQLRMS